MSSLIASIAVAAPLDKALSYLIPGDLQDRVAIGMRVKVPLGRRFVVGFVLALELGEDEELKPIAEVLDAQPLFPAEMGEFFQRIAAYYHHPLGEVIRTALPAGLSGQKQRVSVRREKCFHALPATVEPKGIRQREILLWLRQRQQALISEINAVFPACHQVLKRLLELDLVAVTEVESHRDPFLDIPIEPDRAHVATSDQAEALAAIDASLGQDAFASFLLHGVTGSGKTEVYLKAIARGLELGRQALVLVPEIALTPQLVARFRARFENSTWRIAVLHSGLSDGERYDAWRAIARGEVQVVIGARSAVFAPLADLGVIVVDEEHEASYKQAEGFRYNGRDLALMRGQMNRSVVILGSATPALTTYHRSRSGQSHYLPLADRVQGRPLPEVSLIDLSGLALEGSLSLQLQQALEQNLERGEQSLLLLNRRGFSPYLLCRECGATFHCPNCAITLTYYQSRRQLRCHYCDHSERPPAICSGCGGGSLEPEGAGTERLEEELAAVFPEARIARMDRDTMARKGAHQHMVDRMESGDIDILLGTQMVAKGLDFPRITLVGVIGADATLNLPDFRSAERAFSLLTQVAGRAGRGTHPGQVLIQTYSPEHYALVSASNHDYRKFYAEEIEFRRALGYPPFGYLANLIFSGNDPEKVMAEATDLAGMMQLRNDGVEILGPAPCPLYRLRGRSRYQILLKSSQRTPLHRLLRSVAIQRKKLPRTLVMAIDVDPLDML